jgi:hypothetical protein
LESDQDVVGLRHVLPPAHPLWRFSDSAMHELCYEQWEHHDYFESVLRKHSELWDSRPARLKLKANEIAALSKENRARFWTEVDVWSAKTIEGLNEFLRSLGPQKPDGSAVG